MPEDAQKHARAAIEQWHFLQQRNINTAAAIGKWLIRVRDQIDHGLFLKWLSAEWPASQSSAYNFIAVAENLGDELPTVGSLPPATVYRLAAPGTPASTRAEIIEQLKAGEQIAPSEIDDKIKEAQEAGRKVREAL